MKQITALAWKEWRENSPLLWIALGVFLGLPMIGGMEYMLSWHRHRYQIATEPGVIALGGVFAIFVAVGATCRDLNGRGEDFWRSRPVTGIRWMLVKFVIDLAIVVLSLLLPLLVELIIDGPDRDLQQMMQALPAAWCLFYCIGFLAGCLLQRPAHAAVLALAALLLIYFVPFLLPSWNRFGSLLFLGNSFDNQIADQMEAFIGISAGLFVMAMIAVQWRWHIEPGPKFMYGTIAAAFLIFLFSTGYRLGTNLPVIQQINLMPREEIQSLYMDGNHGYVITAKYPKEAFVAFGPPGYFRRLDVTADGLKLGPPLPLWDNYKKGKPNSLFYYWLHIDGRRNEIRRGDVEYLYYFNESLNMVLDTISFKDNPRGKLATSIPLPIRSAREGQELNFDYSPYIWSNRLYVIGSTLVTVDITQPLSPRVVSSVPMDAFQVWRWLDNRTLVGSLPQIPGLPNAERLQVAVMATAAEMSGDRFEGFMDKAVCDGQILCQRQGNDITEFRLEQLTPKQAVFKRIGESNDVEAFFSWGYADELRLQGGLLYATKVRSDLNPEVKVYATTGPARPRTVGHFSAQSSRMFVDPLPDGRAIVAGSKIWLVGPPPRHD